MSARAVPVAACFVAIRIAVARDGAVLRDLRSDIAEHFATDLLVFLDLLALTLSAVSLYGLLWVRGVDHVRSIIGAVQAYEQLGLFYLGKRYDLDRATREDELVLYDSKDLVTH